MKHSPFLFIPIWLMGFVYVSVLWVISVDVIPVSILFGVLMGLIALGMTIIQFILSRHLFYLLRGFIIMSKLKTKKPKPVETEIEVKKTKKPKPKYKYRDVESNR